MYQSYTLIRKCSSSKQKIGVRRNDGPTIDRAHTACRNLLLCNKWGGFAQNAPMFNSSGSTGLWEIEDFQTPSESLLRMMFGWSESPTQAVATCHDVEKHMKTSSLWRLGLASSGEIAGKLKGLCEVPSYRLWQINILPWDITGITTKQPQQTTVWSANKAPKAPHDP